MRLRLLAAATAAAAVLAVVPALADDQSVRATAGDQFAPKSVTIEVGDTVTWTNEGFHNVHFEDGFVEPPVPNDQWKTVDRTFDKAGTYRYVCDAHEDMTGTVVVREPQATPTPTPGPTPAPGASPTPAPTPAPGASPTPTPTPAPPPEDPAPQVEANPLAYTVEPTAKRFCIRGCRRPGVFLRIDHEAEEKLRLRGTLRRIRGGKARAFGKVRFAIPPGGKRVRIIETRSGRRLAPGRYALRLEPAGGGKVVTVRFRVTRG